GDVGRDLRAARIEAQAGVEQIRRRRRVRVRHRVDRRVGRRVDRPRAVARPRVGGQPIVAARREHDECEALHGRALIHARSFVWPSGSTISEPRFGMWRIGIAELIRAIIAELSGSCGLTMTVYVTLFSVYGIAASWPTAVWYAGVSPMVAR